MERKPDSASYGIDQPGYLLCDSDEPHDHFNSPKMSPRLLPKVIAVVSVCLAAVMPVRAQTITAVTTGNWSDGATWSGGVAPGATDTASFTGLTLTLDGNFTVGALQYGAEGSLTGTNTALTVSGALSLNATFGNVNEHLFATSSSATITVNSLEATDLFAFAGPQEGLWDDNTGSAHWNNLAGATFTLHDSASIITAGVGSLFTNAAGATFAHAGTGSALIQWGFVNHGTLSVAAGSLQFLGTILTSDGSIRVASNATLLLSSSSLSAGATVSLASGATLALTSSTLGAGVSVSGAGSTSLSGAIGFGTGATTFSNVVWSPEASATGMNAALTLSGTVTLNPDQANANEHLYANTGSATMTVNALGATDLFAFAGPQEGLWDDNTGSARWNSLAGATFTLHDSASLITAGVGSIFTNAAGATFVHAGTGSALIQWGFVNHGILSLPTGTLQFLGTTPRVMARSASPTEPRSSSAMPPSTPGPPCRSPVAPPSP